MEPAAVTLEALSQWFLHSLSPLPEPRRHAESSLSAAADHPGFALSVLRLAAEPAADEQIRLAAAVHFKNHLRSRWPPSSDPSIPIPEKDQIKSLIVRLMLSSTPRVRPQLGESLSIISSHDFPASWPSLLPELVSSLHSAIAAPDYSAVNGLLSAASSVFTKFRHSFGGDPIRLDLKYCLDNFAAPLLEIFLTTSQRIAAGPPEALRPLLESQRLCCDIFYSLNSIELPEFFEDHMREWMTEFRVYLTTPYPAPLEADGTADALRAAVCDNLQLYMEKNEEEFKDYLQDFASAVWGLLMTPSTTSPSRDQLTVTAIRFLTTVSTSVHHALFGRADILQQICQSIVLPNVRIRDEDEELFEMNFVEYIRRDIEGSDVDTRRRIACELLKGIASHYKDQVKSLVSMQIQNMLSLYASNPTENWREKDCAIYLVISLNTKMGGGIVDIESFFTSVIIPELQAQNVNASPLLKAGALKFFTVFREQISKQAAISLLPHVIRFLGSESNVVHSYAANCIEKLLLVKDKAPSPTHSSNVVASCPWSAALGIDQILPLLMTNLFNALQFPDSQENPYVMKCIMRVLGVATVVGEVAAACIARLASLLGDVCRNPKDPAFNHYLFEAMAALIRRSCEQDPSLIMTYEASLFPVLQNILVNDITEFWPYAFQIFALLVETSRPPLSENYMQLFQVLLSPDTWKRSANAPALVRLLQAYLQKVPNELNSQGRLSQVLGIFNKLISVSSTEQLGFYVLNTLVENLGYDMISHYVGHIWTAIFTRLLNKRTVKFVNSLVIFMSLVLIKHGPDVLVGSMNAVQNDIFLNILQQFWIPNLKLITERIELKLTSVASTRLLCESSALLDHAASELWGKMLDSIICQLCRPDHNGVEAENEPEFNENVGYSATFARLHYAGRKDDDPLKEISDPNEFLVTSLAKLSAASPGRFGPIIQQFVEPSNRTSLLQFFAAYKCTLI